MDDADYASLAEEQAWRDLERRLEMAHRTEKRMSCIDCGISLPEYRRAYGRCLECAERLEMPWRSWRG
jgi:uncharacterized paraquat-inducible protein A